MSTHGSQESQGSGRLKRAGERTQERSWWGGTKFQLGIHIGALTQCGVATVNKHYCTISKQPEERYMNSLTMKNCKHMPNPLTILLITHGCMKPSLHPINMYNHSVYYQERKEQNKGNSSPWQDGTMQNTTADFSDRHYTPGFWPSIWNSSHGPASHSTKGVINIVTS